MNINGKNGLACLTAMDRFPAGKPIVLRPLPGLPVIRDLIVDMSQFFKVYNSIKPYLINNDPPSERERFGDLEDPLPVSLLHHHELHRRLFQKTEPGKLIGKINEQWSAGRSENG